RAVAVAPAGRIRPSGGHRQARDAHDRLARERAGTPRERGDRMTDAGRATASEPRLGLLPPVSLRGDSARAPFGTAVPGQPVTIGRKATNDLVLRDATVSRDHALIEPTPAGWRITARKSNALLMRSGEQIPESGVLLADGDEITLGRAVVKVTIVPVADDEDADRTVFFVPAEAPPPKREAPASEPACEERVADPVPG